MAYKLIDFSKAEQENVKVLMRNLEELAEVRKEWLFEKMEMPPGAVPSVADVAFFKCGEYYCMATRPRVTYHGGNLSCRQLFAQSCIGFKDGAEIYRFFRYLAHPPAELPERDAEKIVKLDRVIHEGVGREDAARLAAAIRKIAFEYGLVVDRIDPYVIVALLKETEQKESFEEVLAGIRRIFCPFFFRHQQVYPGDYHLKLAGTSLLDLKLFPFGKVLPLRYESGGMRKQS